MNSHLTYSFIDFIILKKGMKSTLPKREGNKLFMAVSNWKKNYFIYRSSAFPACNDPKFSLKCDK